VEKRGEKTVVIDDDGKLVFESTDDAEAVQYAIDHSSSVKIIEVSGPLKLKNGE